MLKSRFAALAAVAVFLACGDGGNSPSPNKFAGTWDATKMEFTNVANTAEKVDVIAAGGTFVILIESTGDYQWTVDIPGEPLETSSGTWSASADVFTTKETGSSGNMQFDWSLNGNTLTLAGANVEFDFDDDGLEDAARLTLVLVKQ